ncbi:MAG: methyltransferase domain-containing protein [Acidobacteria bacterium]|nr:methyltransferase domain-containing protein [Acidobacteriota bacterium]
MQSPKTVRAAYDEVASQYAEKFSDELAHKPLDRELLTRFAASVRPGGAVYDLGCGPGQTTAFLHACGAAAQGIDLSPRLLGQARARHPAINFLAGDMLALPLPDSSAHGLLSFYSIVHFTPPQLGLALREMARALAPGGLLLLAFHVGDQVIALEEFLGRAGRLDFVFHDPQAVSAQLAGSGFVDVEVVEREPYAGVEHPSRRAYVFARRASGPPGR